MTKFFLVPFVLALALAPVRSAHAQTSTISIDATYTPESSRIHGYLQFRQSDIQHFLSLNINAASITLLRKSTIGTAVLTETLQSVPFTAQVGVPVHLEIASSGSAVVVSGDVSFAVTDTVTQGNELEFGTAQGSEGIWRNIAVTEDDDSSPLFYRAIGRFHIH